MKNKTLYQPFPSFRGWWFSQGDGQKRVVDQREPNPEAYQGIWKFPPRMRGSSPVKSLACKHVATWMDQSETVCQDHPG